MLSVFLSIFSIQSGAVPSLNSINTLQAYTLYWQSDCPHHEPTWTLTIVAELQ